MLNWAWLPVILAGCLSGAAQETGECLPDWEPCTNPRPLTNADGSPTGYERCDDGSQNRVSEATIAVPVADRCEDKTPDSEITYGCTADTECSSEQFCKYWATDDGRFCGCQPLPCASDDDCGPGEACYWDGTCIQASCHSGGECPSGECGVWFRWAWDDAESSESGLTCRTPDDDCRTSSTNDCVCQKDFVCVDSPCRR